MFFFLFLTTMWKFNLENCLNLLRPKHERLIKHNIQTSSISRHSMHSTQHSHVWNMTAWGCWWGFFAEGFGSLFKIKSLFAVDESRNIYIKSIFRMATGQFIERLHLEILNFFSMQKTTPSPAIQHKQKAHGATRKTCFHMFHDDMIEIVTILDINDNWLNLMKLMMAFSQAKRFPFRSQFSSSAHYVAVYIKSIFKIVYNV